MNKKLILIMLFLLDISISPRAYSNEFKGLMPWDRKMTVVQPEERNPFDKSEVTSLAIEQKIVKANKISQIYNELALQEKDGAKKLEFLLQAAYWQGAAKGIEENVYTKMPQTK